MNLHTHTNLFSGSKQGHDDSGIQTMGSTFTSVYTSQMTTKNHNTGLGTVLSDSRQSTFSLSFFTLPSMRLLPVVLMLMLASGFWNVGWGQATLPLSRTAWAMEPTGWTNSGCSQRTTSFACSGNDATTFDTNGDSRTVIFSSKPKNLVFALKRSSMSGESKLVVESSDNGSTWTTIGTYGSATGATSITDCGNITIALGQTVRYVKWTYTKVTGNVDMDDVSISSATDGTISANEYGTHTNGQNQQTNGATWLMNWDENNLYLAVSGLENSTNTNNRRILVYIDKDPISPVNGGNDSNGNLTGFNYSNTQLSTLPFRADCFYAIETGYRQLNTANGSGGWSANNTSFGTVAFGSSNNVMEISIPWSTITSGGSRPASFNWVGYVTDGNGGGNYFYEIPNENPGGLIGTTIPNMSNAGFERYYTVSTTTIGSSTPPFSRNSYVFNRLASDNSFGGVSVYDFTMNTSGLQISRGNTGGNWTIGGNLVVNNGTIFFGSPNTNTFGTTSVGNVKIFGGSLNMDQTNQPMIASGNVDISGGSLLLSGNSGGDIKVRGNWNNTGGTFTPSSRAVFLDAASGDQTITKSGGETFDYLIIDKAAGNAILNNDITVNQILTLTNGNINTGAFKVSIPGSGSVSRTNGWINGNLLRTVGDGSNRFDIGTATIYAPATLYMTGTSGTVDITGFLSSASHPNQGSSTIDVAKKANHFWTLTKSGAGTFTYYTGTFNVANTTNTGTVSNYKIAKFDSPSTWSAVGGSASGNDITSASFTSFSDFMAGEEALPPPTISFTGTLSALSTTYGTPSSETSFDVSGADMTTGILVTPPAGYEVSLTSGSGFGASVTVGAAGTITSTPVYVRLKADATVAGSPYSEDIVLSSAGATPVNVPTVASTMSTAALTITGLTGGNKEYNGNTDATFTGTAAYSGLQNGEMFSVTGTPVATFASANVGMGITINVTGYTAPNSNYTLTQTILSANITQKPLTITGIMADNKVYDGDNTATLSGTAALVGVITADLANVTLGGTPVATFDDELVGMNKPVTVIGYSISGSASGNYSLSQPMGLTANITSAALPVITSPLTASGTYGVIITTYNITATNLPTSYDATGLPPGLSVNMTNGEITGTPTAIGTYNVTISATNGGGTGDAVLVFTINPKPLTVSGATADNKIYTRTNDAVISGSMLVGVVGMDDVTITCTGTFAQVTVGTGIAVTSTQMLGGADAAKYTVTLPTGLMADITLKELTISGAAVTPKTYTGTNEAAITGATLVGVINPDEVNVSGGGTFADVNVANGISVTAALSLGGADLGNYSLTQPILTGNITPAPLTITGITADNKIYDATDAATLTGTPAYVGLQNGEMFSVTGTPVSTFNNKNVANGKPVTVTGYTAPSGNYTVTQPSLMANITPAALTVTGATADNKIYNRTNAANISGSTLVGVLMSDVVTITNTGTFAQMTVGTGIAVTSTQMLCGTDAGNYTVTLPSGIMADITPKALTISSAAAQNKVFDGNTTATLTGTLSGVIAPDAVTLNVSGTFASSAVGTGIAVTSTSTLSGADSGNYSLTQPVGLTANITAPVLAAWQFGSPASSGNESTYIATSNNSNLMTTTLSRGSGISATALGRGFASNNWDNGATKSSAISNNEYYQFVLNSNIGYDYSLTTLNATLRRSGPTAPNTYIWQYSTDGTNFSDIGSEVSFTSTVDGVEQAPIDLSGISALQNAKTITFRLYAWGGTSTSATWSIARYGTGITTNCLAIAGIITCVEPIAYNVTGGGSYCSGGSGVAVGLSNSQVVVSYQLQKDNVDTGSPVAGTGSAISFGNQTAVGTYTVVASNTNGSCNLTLDMTGSAGITINALPTAGTCKTDDLCQTNAGTVTVEASGGLAPYDVTWTPAHGTPSSGQSIGVSGGTLLINGLHGGVTYTFTITDANGCSAQ